MPYAILIIDEGFDIYNTRHTYLPREGLGFMNEKSRAPLVRSLLCAVCSLFSVSQLQQSSRVVLLV